MIIAEFRGEYRFLSNFYPCDVAFELIEYPSLEHAYQAAKSLDMAVRMEIGMAKTPGAARRMGQRIRIRPDWKNLRIDVMRNLLWTKFENKELRNLLLATGNAYLEEGNNWGDRFWGTVNGEGTNWLGNLLMDTRYEIKKIRTPPRS